MRIVVGKDKLEMARLAADAAAAVIRKAIAERGAARIIVATGASQFEFLDALVKEPGIDWTKVTGFHLDEYVGLPVEHPASFRKYMRERFVSRTPQPMKAFHEVNGNAPDTATECARLEALVREDQIDVACIGIGENGHIAFNDPPADFDTNAAYRVVPLDEKCRMQQVGEGWFASLDEVPRFAFSMTVKQLMRSREIVCTVPDARKADAVKNGVEGPVTNRCPCSVLQLHPSCGLFLDPPAAAKLSGHATE